MTSATPITISDRAADQHKADALILFVPEKSADSAELQDLDKKLNKALSTVIKDEGFKAKVGDYICYHTSNGIQSGKVVLTGIGKHAGLTEETLRRAAAVGATAARNYGARDIAFVVPSSDVASDLAAVAIAEGAIFGTYRYTRFKTKEEETQPDKKITSVTLLTSNKSSELKAAVTRSQVYIQATLQARDLVNEPANSLNPQTLEDIAKKIAKDSGLEFRVLKSADLKNLGAGAILGVGSGSATPPRIIQLTYTPPGKKKGPKVALVGKGITFDSGGLSLKQSKFMETMKSDMAGAAAVLCAMSALPKLGINKTVTGILCVAENMPSGSAIRPGDVLKAMNGKSIEIINTDAEGRLVLADGLSWAEREGASEIVDLATLTGACIIGLGPYIAGLMGNDRDLARRIVDAGESVGEKFWELPIPDEYDFMIKSDIADIKNLAPNSEAGAIQGALFLREFVKTAKWVHLDIAGPSWYDRDFYHIPKNGTGFGVRTLLKYLSE